MTPTPLPEAPALPQAQAGPRFPWWNFLGAALLASLYLPTFATRFDFIDDGNLVYPSGPMPLGQRLHLVWEKIEANYEHLGPFRPVLWCHWEAEAELFSADELHWRSARLFWTALAAAAFLWLLRELGIRPWAALLAAALAMWNPYRNEIWTSLTLAEGVAMPYALLSLACAIRAARSSRPWRWDIAGILCVLAALGCKNTFAALIPAQVFLRIAPDGRDFLDGVRRRGWRAGLLGLTFLLPVLHYLYFKLHWHSGQYVTQGASWVQLERMLRSLRGAVSLEFTGFGLGLAVAALAAKGWSLRHAQGQEDAPSGPMAVNEGFRPLWDRYRAALVAGFLLLTAGVAAYVPMDAVSGRYTMPAVWGLDLMIAALLSAVIEEARPAWKNVACATFACGLVFVAGASLGRQEKFASRAQLMWNSLQWIEEQVPAGSCVGWQCGPMLNEEEGIHFAWHLQARGRKQVSVVLIDEEGRPFSRSEMPLRGDGTPTPALIITGAPTMPRNGWHMIQTLSAMYWMQKRSYQCYLWSPSEGDQAALPRTMP